MKKRINTLSIYFLLAGFFLCGDATANEVVRLSTGEWSPYISEELESKGLLSQIASEAFALEGVDVKLDFFPWQRVYQLSKTGEYDGTLAYAKTDEREKIYHYSEPIYTGKYVLFHLKSYPLKWNKYEDLKNTRIAATRGFGGMGQEFISAEEKKIIQVDRLASDVQSFKMLLLGRVQAVASDLEVGYVLINKNFSKKEFESIKHNNRLIQHAKYHLVMPKMLAKSEGLIKRFNAGLSALKKSGRYDKILNEYYQKKIYRELIPTHTLKSAKVF